MSYEKEKKSTEKEIQKSILDYLKLKGYLCFKHLNVGIHKPDGSYIKLPEGDKGISDIIGCTKTGQFFAIEVKRPGGHVSPEQMNFLDRVSASGGIGILAYSTDDVMKLL